MAEYIEKSVLLEAFTNADHPIQYPDGSHGLGLGYAGFRTILFDLPPADVRPVVRGKWYWDKDGMDCGIGAWCCSACNTMSPMWWNCDKGSPMHKSGHRFCPNCGADMRGET